MKFCVWRLVNDQAKHSLSIDKTLYAQVSSQLVDSTWKIAKEGDSCEIDIIRAQW